MQALGIYINQFYNKHFPEDCYLDCHSIPLDA